MAVKKSSQKDFKVAETIGKAAEGEDSLLALNNRIAVATKPDDVFIPMKRIVTAAAVQRKLILPGRCKVRGQPWEESGDPDDFLNYATLGYVQRWQAQFKPQDNRRPVQQIQNWIPYVLSTVRFYLIQYNKEVQDYDFLPLPTLAVDFENDDGSSTDKSQAAPETRDPLLFLSLQVLANKDQLHTMLEDLPPELSPYKIDILYCLREEFLTKDRLRDEKVMPVPYFSAIAHNFVQIGKAYLMKEMEQWLMN